jgi:phosphoribosyl-ATP pyrophosphohydrolase
LIGARDVNTGKHWSYKQLLVNVKLYNVKHTNIEHIYNLQDLMNNRSKYKASEKEGYVLRILKEDGTDFFVKIKCEDYLNVHRILNSIRSDKMVIQTVINDTQDDLLSIIPNEYKEEINDKLKIIYSYINELKKLTEEAVELCKGYSDDEKERQIWITNNINSLYASCVRKAIRNQPYSFVRENSKLKDMISINRRIFYKNI